MIVKLKRRSVHHPDLSTGHDYAVIGVEANDLRIINDQGRPYLYPASLFRVVKRDFPDSWVVKRGSEGELYAYPKQLDRIGFFEDYFDGNPKALALFWRVVNEQLVTAG